MARSKAILELAAIEREFAAKRSQIDVSRASEHPLSVRSLTDEQLAGIGDFWSRQVLLADERRREGGLDDEEFEELGSQLQGQRAELGRMLAQGVHLRGILSSIDRVATLLAHSVGQANPRPAAEAGSKLRSDQSNRALHREAHSRPIRAFSPRSLPTNHQSLRGVAKISAVTLAAELLRAAPVAYISPPKMRLGQPAYGGNVP